MKNMMTRMRGVISSAMAAVLAATLLVVVPPPAPAAATSDGLGRHLMGMYPQWNADNPDRFGAVAGRAMESLTLFLDKDKWSETSSSARGLVNLWRDHPSLKVVSFPMSIDGETLAYGNSGANDANIRNIAQILLDGGFEGSVIRVGWEHNGNWSTWSSLDDPDAYTAYYRRIVDIFRDVSPSWRFEWNVNIRYNEVDLRSYPGDD